MSNPFSSNFHGHNIFSAILYFHTKRVVVSKTLIFIKIANESAALKCFTYLIKELIILVRWFIFKRLAEKIEIQSHQYVIFMVHTAYIL